MKTPFKLASLALFCSFLLQSSLLLAQGSLTPPGPPAPTMMTLAQIEPRTPISSAPFTINQWGSYYLTTHLIVTSGTAITIASNGVTLDLNGFSIRSNADSAAGYGILINSGLRNINIANGFIEGGVTNNGGVYSGTGFGYGISYSGNEPVNALVSRVAVAGCLYHGIHLGYGNATVVESCTVSTVGGVGISASTVKQSTAINCGSAIYGRQVADCRGEASGDGDGIGAINAQNCYGSSNGGAGIDAYTTQNCYGSSGSYYGLLADLAVGCYGRSASGTGLHAQNASFCTGYCPGGTAISATIANGCYATSGITSITYKYNMP